MSKTLLKKGDNVLVIIGPEGGFSQREFNYFKDKNLEMLTLGELILKAETATVVALGNIIYEYSINKNKIDNDEILNNLSSFFPNEIYLVGGCSRLFSWKNFL